MTPPRSAGAPRALGPSVVAWTFALVAGAAPVALAGEELPPPSRRTVVAGGRGPEVPVPPAPLPPARLDPVASSAPDAAPPPTVTLRLAPVTAPVAAPLPSTSAPRGPRAEPPVPASAMAAPARPWHVRVGGGATFGVLGIDPPDPGPTGGADVGVTFASGIGVDVFYRADVVRFRLADDPALTKDAGTLHHVGAKCTYETPRGPGRPLGLYVGAGPVWTFTDGFATSSRGLGVHGEAGLSLDLGARWRVRVGAELRAFESDVGRNVAADEGQDRWVYTVSPVVFLQFDL